MKYLLAIALLAISLSAQAVDITITLTASQATRAAAACGVVKQLVDAQKQPRACTMAEAKTYIIERLRQLVVDVEGAAAEKARGPATIPAFDPS